MYEDAEVMERPDELLEEDAGPVPVRKERSSVWALVPLGFLALLLIWIVLGIWRYLQVLGYGSP
jgi:hypothetical protein